MMLEGKRLLITGVLTPQSIAFHVARVCQGEGARTAFQTSAFSLKAIATGMLPLMKQAGGAVVSLDFDATVAWPVYDWMGVSKAALEAITRYLARDLGPFAIRVNCVSAGPLRTIAAKGVPGFDGLAS